MNKPQPKAEIVVRGVGEHHLRITPTSNDARLWVEREAVKYGRLYWPLDAHGYYDLWVSDAYSDEEVARYLESYNGQEAAP